MGHTVAGYACEITFSPDGRYIACGDGSGRTWFWDWKTSKLLKTLRCHDQVSIGCEWHPIEPSRVGMSFYCCIAYFLFKLTFPTIYSTGKFLTFLFLSFFFFFFFLFACISHICLPRKSSSGVVRKIKLLETSLLRSSWEGCISWGSLSLSLPLLFFLPAVPIFVCHVSLRPL